MKSNKKIILSIVVILIAIAGVFGYSKLNSAKEQPKIKAEENITIKHKLGEVNIKKNPKNIVVFDYAVVDSLDKMSIDIKALPKSNIPNYLDKYKNEKYMDAGTLFEPNYEKIQELKPELIIISARQASVYDKLNEIAPTVYLEIDASNYFDSFKKNMETLGQIFDKEKFVKEELAKIDEATKLLNEKVTSKNQNALVIMANEGSLSAFGHESRFGIIHTSFGFKEADEKIEKSQHGMNVSFEYLAEKNPDYLFVIDRAAVTGKGDSAQKTLDNDIVKGMAAYKNNKIIYLDSQIWYVSSGGLIGTNNMIDEVSKAVEK